MFVGSINQQVRQFLGNVATVFTDREVVIGCSGNFTMETVLTATSAPRAIHSNDVSLYSCLIGRWLSGDPLPVAIKEEEFAWLRAYLDTPERTIAAVMVLLDMLPFVKQRNAHQARMWGNYLATFPGLVDKTIEKMGGVSVRIASFFAGDVLEHFERFAGQTNAVFCCFAPTYSGGYERLYKRLEEIVAWPAPTYPMLDEARRAALLAWMQERDYLWYDDRVLEGVQPVMQQRRGRMRTVYLYSNVVRRSTLLSQGTLKGLPKWPLASKDFTITQDAPIHLAMIKTTELAAYKDAYLGKAIAHGAGQWAFAVIVAGVIIGFVEFMRGKYGGREMYLNADFAVPNTIYQRLSKLVVMAAGAGETRKLLERLGQRHVKGIMTTAFTDRPMSMKYRGVLELLKRGHTPERQAFLNYGGDFTTLSWQETLQQWLTKHGSRTSSRN